MKNPFQNTSGVWPGPDPLTTEHVTTAPEYRDDYPESDPEGSSLGYQHPGATVPLAHEFEPEDVEPIPVRVVSSEQPSEVRRRMATTTIPVSLANQLSGNQSLVVRVLNMRSNRTKAKIVVKNRTGAAGQAGRVWISGDEAPGPFSGYPLDYGDSLETNTTDDVWAALDPGAAQDALVCVYEEFETTMPVHHAGTAEHKHLGESHL